MFLFRLSESTLSSLQRPSVNIFGAEFLPRHQSMFRLHLNRQYSYSPTALGREPSERECEANAGTFARK